MIVVGADVEVAGVTERCIVRSLKALAAIVCASARAHAAASRDLSTTFLMFFLIRRHPQVTRASAEDVKVSEEKRRGGCVGSRVMVAVRGSQLHTQLRPDRSVPRQRSTCSPFRMDGKSRGVASHPGQGSPELIETAMRD